MIFGTVGLALYVGETLYVWIDTINHYHNMDDRLKKEGYIFNVRKFDKSDIGIMALSALAMSTPIFNLVIPLAHRDKEECYDIYKNNLLDAGSIDEPDEKLEMLDNKYILTINNSKLIERNNNNGHVYYSTMNNNEQEQAKSLKKVIK